MPKLQEILQGFDLARRFLPNSQRQVNTQGGFDLNSLLMPRQTNWPQIGLGTALMGSTLLVREEPGYVTEARQNVRNLSSPTGFSSGFTNTVGGLQSQFQPLIEQQRNLSLIHI